jgi:hypothetical protein
MRWPNSFGGGGGIGARTCSRWIRGNGDPVLGVVLELGGGGGGCPVGSTILGEAEEARAAWAFEIYLKCLGNSKFCPTSFSLHLVANKINSK